MRLSVSIMVVGHSDTLIMPYIDYYDIFYMNSNLSQINKLQTLQNRALRICHRTRPKVPTDMLHQSFQIPTLEPRREIHLLNFKYKNKSNVKNINNRNIPTRLHDAPVFTTIKPTCEEYTANVYYNGAILWNVPPVRIRNTTTYNIFKENIKMGFEPIITQCFFV